MSRTEDHQTTRSFLWVQAFIISRAVHNSKEKRMFFSVFVHIVGSGNLPLIITRPRVGGVCVWLRVCMCACVRARAGGWWREREGEREGAGLWGDLALLLVIRTVAAQKSWTPQNCTFLVLLRATSDSRPVTVDPGWGEGWGACHRRLGSQQSYLVHSAARPVPL